MFGLISTSTFCTEYALSQHRSLWASAMPIPLWYKLLVACYMFCSVGCKVLAIAAACTLATGPRENFLFSLGSYDWRCVLILPIMACYMLFAWLMFVNWHYCVLPSREDPDKCRDRCRAAYQALVSTTVVCMPWNTALARPPFQRRRWWPSATYQALGAVTLGLAVGIPLTLAVPKDKCMFECRNGLLPLGQEYSGPFLALAICMISFVTIETIMFSMLSFVPHIARQRSPTDNWMAIEEATFNPHDAVLVVAKVVGTVLGSSR